MGKEHRVLGNEELVLMSSSTASQLSYLLYRDVLAFCKRPACCATIIAGLVQCETSRYLLNRPHNQQASAYVLRSVLSLAVTSWMD